MNAVDENKLDVILRDPNSVYDVFYTGPVIDFQHKGFVNRSRWQELGKTCKKMNFDFQLSASLINCMTLVSILSFAKTDEK
jgi:hypothetical protein